MSRSTFLLHTEQQLVDDFSATINDIFGDYPYLVGSALERPDYRDIDLRIILADDEFDELYALVNIEMIGIAISLWGQKATGLPIDFQIQRRSNANQNYKGVRNCMGMRPTAGVRLNEHPDNRPIKQPHTEGGDR
ncbi:hypothetical protein [Paeniglutamicibacter sp. NPDC091659]|uniref:hypothetical protein n=1 Tax=Paeniglutamicibacter sp. NPDC091659 TaxID=3364389 RepID=UPI00382C7225